MGNECSLVDGCSEEELIYLIPSLFYISTPNNNICSQGFSTKRLHVLTGDYTGYVSQDAAAVCSFTSSALNI